MNCESRLLLLLLMALPLSPCVPSAASDDAVPGLPVPVAPPVAPSVVVPVEAADAGVDLPAPLFVGGAVAALLVAVLEAPAPAVRVVGYVSLAFDHVLDLVLKFAQPVQVVVFYYVAFEE
mmetsp:Transcript_6899/g.12245  ORF Transcript_6899/g.12245 Transcript_6899/m.12245 type:complete len:120 (+) Transcript_6899:1471-1830(+)